MTEKLQVILAGYNVDVNTINNPKLKSQAESLPAGYARISRSDKSVTELRAESLKNVKEARESNKKIIFEYGHGSIAEHEVFNFDILGISRLALEPLERFRLASYTEKSQRYVKGADSMVPSEFKPEHAEKLLELDNEGHALYNQMLNAGVEKEDARFVHLLSTVGQLGMTANARELEHMIVSLQGSPLDELKDISNKLYDNAVKVAPSLFKMHPDNFRHNFSKRYGEAMFNTLINSIKDKSIDIYDLINGQWKEKMNFGVQDVQILKNKRSVLAYNPNPEANIVANVLFAHSKLNLEESYQMAQAILTSKNNFVGTEFFKDILQDMDQHSTAPREFENGAFNFQFTNSSSSYAQLKRHRTATLLQKPYDLSLGYTTPQGVIDAGFQQEYDKYMQKVESFVKELKLEYGQELSEYGMTNAHRRLSLFIPNARSLYNFSRLREDAHAQWEIRADANDALKLVKEVAPLTFMLAGGKSEFDKIRERVYSTKK